MQTKDILITITVVAGVLAVSSQQAIGIPWKPVQKAKPVVKPNPPKPVLHPTKYSGRAIGVDLTNCLGSVAWRLADTGPLPACGGSLEVVAGATNLADLLSVGGAQVSASGIAGVSTSRAGVTNFS